VVQSLDCTTSFFHRECGITFRVYPLRFRNYTLQSHIKRSIFASVKQRRTPHFVRRLLFTPARTQAKLQLFQTRLLTEWQHSQYIKIMKTTMKTFAMAAMMMLTTAATAFAHNNPGMRNDNHRKPTTVVVINDNHARHENIHGRNHRHLSRPVHRCMCKHCKRMRHDMEMARRHRDADMHRMDAHRPHNMDMRHDNRIARR